jgi:hypothetical protein
VGGSGHRHQSDRPALRVRIEADLFESVGGLFDSDHTEGAVELIAGTEDGGGVRQEDALAHAGAAIDGPVARRGVKFLKEGFVESTATAIHVSPKTKPLAFITTFGARLVLTDCRVSLGDWTAREGRCASEISSSLLRSMPLRRARRYTTS